jgi:hypothetical protein
MIEYSYPECTTSVLTALSIFKRHYPDYRRDDIECVSAYTTSLIDMLIHLCEKIDDPTRNQVPAQGAASQRGLVWELGYFLHLRDHVCSRVALVGRRNVRDERCR